jgi:putative tryptophan/tyrosine transport system substrate-binding protein
VDPVVEDPVAGSRGRSALRRITPAAALLLVASLLCPALLTPAAGAGGVAVLLTADVEEYRRALRGLKDTLRHAIVAEHDMEGDFDRGRKAMAEIRSKVQPDIIVAIGIWALQVAARESTDVPIVYAMVMNPPSVIQPGAKNITGASMNVPVDQSIRLFRQLGPQIRRIGVIYNPAKTGYLVQRAQAAARAHGAQLLGREVSSPKEAITALESMQDTIDALWILPDETTLAPPVVQQMLLVSYRRKIPLLGLSESQVQMGALLSLSFASGEDIGRQAGELCNAILAGKAASDIPYTTARQLKLAVNLKAAQKLGLEIPRTILDRADRVIQ